MVLNSMEREFVVKTFPHDKTKNAIEKLTLDGRIKLAQLFRLWSFVRNNINKKEVKGTIACCTLVDKYKCMQ